MGIFGLKKLTFKKEIKVDKVVFNVGYYKVKYSWKYKKALLEGLTGSSTCMAVINSRIMYKGQKNKFHEEQQVLLSKLDGMGIRCSTLPVMREEESTIFGLSVKQGEKKIYEDLVIGFVMEGSDIEAVLKAVDGYNVYYYTGCSTCGKDELLESFRASFDDEAKLKASFRFSMLDDSFVEGMVLSCHKEDAAFVSEQLELLQHNV